MGHWRTVDWQQDDNKLHSWRSCGVYAFYFVFVIFALIQAILFCYDITNMESFANLEDWYRIALSAQDEEPVFSVLIGNKSLLI